MDEVTKSVKEVLDNIRAIHGDEMGALSAVAMDIMVDAMQHALLAARFTVEMEGSMEKANSVSKSIMTRGKYVVLGMFTMLAPRIGPGKKTEVLTIIAKAVDKLYLEALKQYGFELGN